MATENRVKQHHTHFEGFLKGESISLCALRTAERGSLQREGSGVKCTGGECYEALKLTLADRNREQRGAQ